LPGAAFACVQPMQHQHQVVGTPKPPQLVYKTLYNIYCISTLTNSFFPLAQGKKQQKGTKVTG
jgi:hypothetical protein